MLINPKTGNAPKVIARPTHNGNGFIAGQLYTFEHYRNGLYQCFPKEGLLRFEDFCGGISSHLWDNTNPDRPVWGHFDIVQIITAEDLRK